MYDTQSRHAIHYLLDVEVLQYRILHNGLNGKPWRLRSVIDLANASRDGELCTVIQNKKAIIFRGKYLTLAYNNQSIIPESQRVVMRARDTIRHLVKVYDLIVKNKNEFPERWHIGVRPNHQQNKELNKRSVV